MVNLIGFCSLRSPYALVLELMSEGTLEDLLLSDTELPWHARLTIAIDIAHGIEVLHKHNPLVCNSIHSRVIVFFLHVSISFLLRICLIYWGSVGCRMGSGQTS